MPGEPRRADRAVVRATGIRQADAVATSPALPRPEVGESDPLPGQCCRCLGLHLCALHPFCGSPGRPVRRLNASLRVPSSHRVSPRAAVASLASSGGARGWRQRATLAPSLRRSSSIKPRNRLQASGAASPALPGRETPPGAALHEKAAGEVVRPRDGVRSMFLDVLRLDQPHLTAQKLARLSGCSRSARVGTFVRHVFEAARSAPASRMSPARRKMVLP